MKLDSPLYGAALMLAGLLFGLDAVQWYASSDGSSTHMTRVVGSLTLFLVGLLLFLLAVRNGRRFN
ncbi:MAG: hypothetical protein H0T60_05525 [Acidobacteria bacterium]|nr:hypothetical protein [Acidobacteriota bacterium]